MPKNNQSFSDYAVIDLGSNSFHMLIVQKNNELFTPVYKNKRSIHLASGLNESNTLSTESINKALDCLTIFATRLINFPLSHVKVVATHALRVATNRQTFLIKAKEVFPYPIEVISGQEEAKLIYKGVIKNQTINEANIKFIIDIGGGSTEIAVGTNETPIIAESRPMGCVSFAHKFFPDKKITQDAFDAACFEAKKQVNDLIERIKNLHINIAFGSSGTIKIIYKILIELGMTDTAITIKNLEKLKEKTLKFKYFDDLNFISLSDDRKSIFVSGLAIFYGVFTALDLQEINFSNSALREGLLYDLTSNNE